MKIKDLNNKSRTELEATLIELRTALMQLKFDLADTKVKDFSKVSSSVAIARMLAHLLKRFKKK